MTSLCQMLQWKFIIQSFISSLKTSFQTNMSKRGRKPSKVDQKVKLERSRQSARECCARKKLRYQYVEELVAAREKAIYALRGEMESVSISTLIPKWAAQSPRQNFRGVKVWLYWLDGFELCPV